MFKLFAVVPHVETVVLLSKLHDAKYHIEFEVSLNHKLLFYIMGNCFLMLQYYHKNVFMGDGDETTINFTAAKGNL